MELKHEANRIYVEDGTGKLIAEITFPAVSDARVNFDHTFVDPSLRGQGMANTLMQAAVADIQAKNLKATATCPFASQWLEEHPEIARSLAE